MASATGQVMLGKKPQSEYQKAVDSFLNRNHVKSGCHGPKHFEQEPYFSWQPCECCGSRLGGNREDYLFSTIDSSEFAILEAAICTDCVYYLAYGKLDDLTMLEISGTK